MSGRHGAVGYAYVVTAPHDQPVVLCRHGPLACKVVIMLAQAQPSPALLHCGGMASWQLELEGVGWWALGLGRRRQGGALSPPRASPWRSVGIAEGVVVAANIANDSCCGGRF